jgi:hypothetical protein
MLEHWYGDPWRVPMRNEKGLAKTTNLLHRLLLLSTLSWDAYTVAAILCHAAGSTSLHYPVPFVATSALLVASFLAARRVSGKLTLALQRRHASAAWRVVLPSATECALLADAFVIALVISWLAQLDRGRT